MTTYAKQARVENLNGEDVLDDLRKEEDSVEAVAEYLYPTMSRK
jgi:hypothetical protein